jgi:hypothetical protein
MRAGLLSELSVIGYEIFLQGENIRLKYQRPDTPPESARLLIDELRKHKAEAVNILKMGDTNTPTEKSQPEANVKAAWPPDVQTLLNWFLTLDPPKEPFHLEPHRRIVDPEKFYSALRREIGAGQRGPRARMGTLQCDLRKLKAYLN